MHPKANICSQQSAWCQVAIRWAYIICEVLSLIYQAKCISTPVAVKILYFSVDSSSGSPSAAIRLSDERAKVKGNLGNPAASAGRSWGHPEGGGSFQFIWKGRVTLPSVHILASSFAQGSVPYVPLRGQGQIAMPSASDDLECWLARIA